MRVFELSYPGSWLELESESEASKVQVLLMSLELCFHQAAVEVGLFVEIREKLRAAHTVRVCGKSITRERDLQEWASLPDIYVQRIPFIYARSFLYTLHNIRQYLNTIATLESVPQETKKSIARLDDYFPSLKGVRDSSAHVEERVQGMTRKKPIVSKPVENQFIRAPSGGVQVVESLMNDWFVSTTADGELGKVEVSYKSIEKVRDCIQRTLNSLPWIGPSRRSPDSSHLTRV